MIRLAERLLCKPIFNIRDDRHYPYKKAHNPLSERGIKARSLPYTLLKRLGVSALSTIPKDSERPVILGEYIIEHRATVRQAASEFGISKSTVHKDVSERLKKVKPSLYKEVRVILDINKQERHIRGGEATKQKYRELSGIK